MSERIAAVTGAARGIGLAITRALGEAGCFVQAIDRDADALAISVAKLCAEGLSVAGSAADLTEPEEVRRVFAELAEARGGLDALVNNAGTCFMNDVVDIGPDELRAQFSVNFDAAFFCVQQALPLMLARPGVKKIVNISSNGAYNFEVFDPVHYRASKAALDTMTRHLARRYAEDKICVNSIAPAMTQTELFDVVPREVLAEAIAGMPRKEPMRPTEVAAWVAFLVSPAGDCCSGNVIILNQGRDVR